MLATCSDAILLQGSLLCFPGQKVLFGEVSGCLCFLRVQLFSAKLQIKLNSVALQVRISLFLMMVHLQANSVHLGSGRECPYFVFLCLSFLKYQLFLCVLSVLPVLYVCAPQPCLLPVEARRCWIPYRTRIIDGCKSPCRC